MLYAIAVVEE